MPRQPRIDAFRSSFRTFGPALLPGSSTGVLHHITVLWIERRAIFRDDQDRVDFVAPRATWEGGR